MAIETIIEPYELLIRWKGGAITGAHFVQTVRTVRDGETIATTELAPESVVDLSGDGSLVDEVLGIVQTSALADKATAETAAVVANEQVAALHIRVAELEQDNATMNELIEGERLRRQPRDTGSSPIQD
jgi:hypothetical protein